MKRLLIFPIFLFISLFAFAKQVQIKGLVIDQVSQKPMPFVGVTLMVGDSLVKGTMASENGQFLLENISTGNYELRVSFVGYKTVSKKIAITGKQSHVNIGNIVISEDAKMLKDVEIVAQGSQLKFEVDKKVFSVDQNIANAGGSISEVLQNVPSVDVDTEGNISLRNSSSVEVWINGKPAGLTEENRAQILEQMPAGSIESIELITNPSAKYSPEGTAGIINLVLKKDRKAGYYGNATLGAIVPAKSKIGELAGVNVNLNKGKVDAYLNVGFRNWMHIHEGVTNRYYLSNTDTIATLNQQKDYDHHIYGINGRFGLTYHLTDKHAIGISAFGLSGKGIFDEWIGYDKKDALNTSVSNYDRISYETFIRKSGNATLDYAWKIDKKGSELRSSISYAFFNMKRDVNYLQVVNSGNGFNSDQKQNLDGFNYNWHFKTDYSQKIFNNGKLETGIDIKNQIRHSFSDGANKVGAAYIDVPAMYNSYDYDEQIYAFYATYGSKIKRFSYQAGLRAEQTIVNTQSESVAYSEVNTTPDFQLYPSAFIAYTISKNDELQLNYTRRIDRPKGRRLNPFKDFSDSTNISYGNPFLKPEFTAAYELNYIHNYGKKGNQSLSSSIYYRFTDNVIQQIRFINNAQMYSTYMNVSQSQSSGLELISKNDLAKFLNLTSTVNMYYYYLEPSIFEPSPTQQVQINGNESFSWNARIIANLMFSKTFSGQITGNYASPKAIAQGMTRSNFTLDLGLRKSFINRTLNVALSVRDVLNSRARISETYSDDFWQYDEFASPGPTVTLNLTYNFGNGKKNGKAKNKNGEEMNNEDAMEEF